MCNLCVLIKKTNPVGRVPTKFITFEDASHRAHKCYNLFIIQHICTELKVICVDSTTAGPTKEET